MSDQDVKTKLLNLNETCVELKKQYQAEEDFERKKKLKVEFHLKLDEYQRLKESLDPKPTSETSTSSTPRTFPRPYLNQSKTIPQKQKPPVSSSKSKANSQAAKASAIAQQPISPESSHDKAINAVKGISDGVEQNDGIAFAPLAAVAAGSKIAKAIVELGGAILLLIVRGFVAPAEMLFRRGFGERYHNALTILSMISIYGAGAHFLGFSARFIVIISVFVVLRLWFNVFLCFYRDRVGKYWHSYSQGVSYFSGLIDDYFARRNFTFEAGLLILEPLALFLLATIFHFVVPADFNFENPFSYETFEVNRISLWLLLLSVVCFCYQLVIFFHRRNLLLNELDAEAIAEARKVSRTSEKAPGIFHHRGVAYVCKGGKSSWAK